MDEEITFAQKGTKVTLPKLERFLEEKLKSHPHRSAPKTMLEVSGSWFDAYYLIKKYNLQILRDSSTDPNVHTSYFDQKITFPKTVNAAYISRPSMYLQYCVCFNIHGYLAKINISDKSKAVFEGYHLVNDFYDPDDLVVLDIETTGLAMFYEDIIEMSLYDIASGKTYTRRLPLEKRECVPVESTKIHRITTEMLKEEKPLSQAEFDELYQKFDLDKKIVMVWTPGNYFDITMLRIYFLDHGLHGIENIHFFNGKNYVGKFNKEFCCFESLAKDYVAGKLRISTVGAHSSLGDCKIEAEIIKKIFLIQNKGVSCTIKPSDIFQDLIDRKLNRENAVEYYQRMVDYCRSAHGLVDRDYDDKPRKRGREWIDIHHIDETEIDDIAAKTQFAEKMGIPEALEVLHKYNRKDRLVYATVVEHFLLHYIIEFIRNEKTFNGGPHYMFGKILRMKFGVINYPYESAISQKFDSYFSKISFEQITSLYKDVLSSKHLNKVDVIDFYCTENPTKEVNDFIDGLFK